jgi:hypothetical protein
MGSLLRSQPMASPIGESRLLRRREFVTPGTANFCAAHLGLRDDPHPHVHLIVPGRGISARRQELGRVPRDQHGCDWTARCAGAASGGALAAKQKRSRCAVPDAPKSVSWTADETINPLVPPRGAAGTRGQGSPEAPPGSPVAPIPWDVPRCVILTAHETVDPVGSP